MPNEELKQERSTVGQRNMTLHDITDRVWVRDRPLVLDRQGLQNERYALPFDHSLSLLGPAYVIPQLYHPFDSRLWVESRVSFGTSWS